MLNFCQDICKICNIYKEYENITKCELNQPKLKSDENIVQITDDGGIIKRIIKEGKGDLPKNGQEIIAHYEGTLLDGTVFDSSYSRDTPFKFLLGKGRVIKAWDKSFATMKKGEQALITAEPEYAYGTNGNIPNIPSNSILQFKVELLDFK